MSTISVRNVTKKYGAVTAIPDLSLEVTKGEFIVLVGPSGCGKSTLLRMLAGLESITEGEVAIDGEVVNNMMPRQRNIAMVFQSYALYPHMTVAGNMGFSLKLDGADKAEVAARVNEVAKILALESLLDRKPAQLSGGQRQRVAMGRSIVRDPSVFLFDEPLSNLDAKLRVQMRAEIKSLHNRLGTTIVYVTHDQIEAMTMADRIVVMNAGTIEQVGAPLDLYDQPANLFVAEFLGSPSMNLIDGTISDSGTVVLGSGLELPLGASLRAGAEVTLGIRPEYISLSDTGGMKVRCMVSVIEPTGPATILVVEMGDEKVTIEVTGRVAHKVGDFIDIWMAKEHCHLFDTSSGIRLDQ
ncbi:Maltose/maltodextrin transport ATP-binding protein MalK (plasmid) [Marinovum algicola DG 898]|nr:Maltose/maltodextrin transport ATP-binding protein MalK [Marinovum algicola DG 898]